MAKAPKAATVKKEAPAPVPKDPTKSQAKDDAGPTTEGLKKAPAAVVDTVVPKVTERRDYDVICIIEGERFGPYSPSEGAVDESEAIQRVLDEVPALKPHLTRCRWDVNPRSSDVSDTTG